MKLIREDDIAALVCVSSARDGEVVELEDAAACDVRLGHEREDRLHRTKRARPRHHLFNGMATETAAGGMGGDPVAEHGTPGLRADAFKADDPDEILLRIEDCEMKARAGGGGLSGVLDPSLGVREVVSVSIPHHPTAEGRPRRVGSLEDRDGIFGRERAKVHHDGKARIICRTSCRSAANAPDGDQNPMTIVGEFVSCNGLLGTRRTRSDKCAQRVTGAFGQLGIQPERNVRTDMHPWYNRRRDTPSIGRTHDDRRILLGTGERAQHPFLAGWTRRTDLTNMITRNNEPCTVRRRTQRRDTRAGDDRHEIRALRPVRTEKIVEIAVLPSGIRCRVVLDHFERAHIADRMREAARRNRAIERVEWQRA